MTCTRCKTEMPDGARYCSNCALLLKRPLPGKPVKPTKEQKALERGRWGIEHERQAMFTIAIRTATKRHEILTEQEWWVARLISHGHKDESIGHQLDITVSRVKKIVPAIKRKANVTQRTEIARWFIGL